jgi:excisionase family DNA binding protein
MEDQVYTVEEVAEYLKITRKGVYDLMRAGKLRYFNVGIRRRRVSREALMEFVRNEGLGNSHKPKYNPNEILKPTQAPA